MALVPFAEISRAVMLLKKEPTTSGWLIVRSYQGQITKTLLMEFGRKDDVRSVQYKFFDIGRHCDACT